MNPFDKAEFKEALSSAFVEAITKIGIGNFKRISWFASNQQVSTAKQAA